MPKKQKNDDKVEKELAELVKEHSENEEHGLSSSDNEENMNVEEQCDNSSHKSSHSKRSNHSDSEFEEIDVTENPLYQVLSAFFETEEGQNVCDILKDLTEAVSENTKMMAKLLKQRK